MAPTGRRQFLGRAAVTLGSATLAPFAIAGCSDDDGNGSTATGGNTASSGAATTGPHGTGGAADTSALPTTTAAPPAVGIDPEDPSTWRAQFALDDDAHFAAFTLAAHPRAVAEAVARHRRGLDEDTAGYLLEHGFELDQSVVGEAASYLDADPGELALTDSTTMGLGVVYGGMRFAAGDEIVTTEHDFFATHEALRLRAVQTGARIERVRLYRDPATATVDAMVSRLIDAVTPRTRLMAVTWTHSGTGVKLPIADIGAALADVNRDREKAERVLLCVDAVHAFGLETATPAELGCDVLMSGTHKWLFGPRGTGLVWINRAALARVDPVIPPFEGESFAAWQNERAPEPATSATRLTPGGYHSFEHRWALAEAFELHRQIGKERVREHTHSQATQLKEGLAEIDGIRLVTPMSPDVSSGIVCIDTPGRDLLEVFLELKRRGYRSSPSPYRTQYLRFGPSIVTSPDEVTGLVDALAAIV